MILQVWRMSILLHITNKYCEVESVSMYKIINKEK